MHPDRNYKLSEPNQQANFATTAECPASRLPYWSELKEHERIERLRDVVKRLETRLEMAEGFIRALIEHKHDVGGGLVGPLDLYRYMPKVAKADWEVKAADERKPDDVYF